VKLCCVPGLSEANRHAKISLLKELLKKVFSYVSIMLFTDKKTFQQWPQPPHCKNSQNCRLDATRAATKKQGI